MNIALKEVFNKDTIEFHKLAGLVTQHLTPVPLTSTDFIISLSNPQSKLIDIPVEINSKYRRELENFIIENNINFTTDSELDNMTFENQELDKIEQGIIHNMSRCLKTSAYAHKFYTEYAQNPKLKIQNFMHEQKRYTFYYKLSYFNRHLNVMANHKIDPIFDLDNEEQYSQFFKENQSWIYPEVEDYANEIALSQEIQKIHESKIEEKEIKKPDDVIKQ